MLAGSAGVVFSPPATPPVFWTRARVPMRTLEIAGNGQLAEWMLLTANMSIEAYSVGASMVLFVWA